MTRARVWFDGYVELEFDETDYEGWQPRNLAEALFYDSAYELFNYSPFVERTERIDTTRVEILED